MCKAIEPIHGHVSNNEKQNAVCCAPNCEKEALAVAAAMEKGTTHPIGRFLKTTVIFFYLACWQLMYLVISSLCLHA